MFINTNFYPRPPHGERRTACRYSGLASLQFLSTPPAWGATSGTEQLDQNYTISIHAPRMGSDAVENGPGPIRPISIHAPRMGSDHFPGFARFAYANFYPRPPHGERPVYFQCILDSM